MRVLLRLCTIGGVNSGGNDPDACEICAVYLEHRAKPGSKCILLRSAEGIVYEREVDEILPKSLDVKSPTGIFVIRLSSKV